MQRIMQNKAAILVFLLPALLLFTAIIIAPVFMSLFYSLNEWNGIGDMTFIGLENYIELFSSSEFPKAMLNAVIFALASVVIQLPLSMLLALVLSNRVKGERFFVTVFFIPVILSSVIIGQLWMRMYNQDTGVINLFLQFIGVIEKGVPWLGTVDTAMAAVMIPVLWQYVGYHMLLYYSGINSISPDIFEAARIDGAGFWRTAFSITIPMLKPVIMVSLTFAVVGSMKVYDLVKVLTNGGPAGASEVITTLMVRTMIYPGTSYGSGSAMSVILIIECFVLYMFIRRMFRERGDLVPKALTRRDRHAKV